MAEKSVNKLSESERTAKLPATALDAYFAKPPEISCGQVIIFKGAKTRLSSRVHLQKTGVAKHFDLGRSRGNAQGSYVLDNKIYSKCQQSSFCATPVTFNKTEDFVPVDSVWEKKQTTNNVGTRPS